jgi:hypothetical protein
MGDELASWQFELQGFHNARAAALLGVCRGAGEGGVPYAAHTAAAVWSSVCSSGFGIQCDPNPHFGCAGTFLRRPSTRLILVWPRRMSSGTKSGSRSTAASEAMYSAAQLQGPCRASAWRPRPIPLSSGSRVHSPALQCCGHCQFSRVWLFGCGLGLMPAGKAHRCGTTAAGWLITW